MYVYSGKPRHSGVYLVNVSDTNRMGHYAYYDALENIWYEQAASKQKAENYKKINYPAINKYKNWGFVNNS